MNQVRIFTASGSYLVAATGLQNAMKYDRGYQRHESVNEPAKPKGHVYDSYSLEQLKVEAEKMNLSKVKWGRMGEEKLRNYLKEQ